MSAPAQAPSPAPAPAVPGPPAGWLVTAVELFILANLAFLAVDVWMAHSVNAFAHPAEWVPLVFSLAAPPVLAVDVVLDLRRGKGVRSRLCVAPFGPSRQTTPDPFSAAGRVVGALSVAVGVTGMLLHLESSFFRHATLHSLVYTAPFVAPLAYTGLGFLLLLNRMARPGRDDWGLWVLFLGAAGFLGNFVLAVCDHAQNGFFHVTEWMPVVSAAFVVGFLAVPFLLPVGRRYLNLCLIVLAVQVPVGVAGFLLHLRADLAGPAPALLDRLIHGAPVFAPMLFADLALLCALGILDLRSRAAC